MTLFLSRASLRRDAPIASLAELLVPSDPHERTGASHKLAWSLFSDSADRRRDFLWREDRPGAFMALSNRPPENPHNLFELQSKVFAPDLVAGDRLGFSLRVNPTVSRSSAPGRRGQRHDVVMDALYNVPRDQRAAARPDAIQTAGRDWLVRQGEAHGFEPDAAVIDGYDVLRVPRQGGRPATFGVLDISGVLAVTDPDLFLVKLAAGFGRGRSFGLGLMLIRRVH